MMQRVGSARDTSLKCVKLGGATELKNELRKGNCVLRASARTMGWVVAPWMDWEIQNECNQSRDRDSRAGMEPLGQ